jgi:hypothetical protein
VGHLKNRVVHPGGTSREMAVSAAPTLRRRARTLRYRARARAGAYTEACRRLAQWISPLTQRHRPGGGRVIDSVPGVEEPGGRESTVTRTGRVAILGP